MHDTGWDHRLDVRADGKNLIGHAGVVLLRKVVDRVGLAAALGVALPKGAVPGWRDRGIALVQLACAIALGATNILEAEQLQCHWRPVFGRSVSDSTLRRTLQAVDAPVAARIERARAVIRRVVWTLLALRPGGFPWISVCGRELTGWYVLDLDATIVTCTSTKEGAAGTYKGSFGHMPLGAWVARTRECVAMLLRPGNAPPNDVADHKAVLAAALRQLPLPLWSKLLVRIDGAAFSHEVLDHLQQLSTSRRRVRWVTGWAINAVDEQASRGCPPPARPAHRPRPPVHFAPGPHLALGSSVHHSLATRHQDSGPPLTASHHPTRTRKEQTCRTPAPWKPAHPQRHAKAPRTDLRDKTGQVVGPARPIRSQTNRGQHIE